MPHRILARPEDIDDFVWVSVFGYEGRLEINRAGGVRSCDRLVRSRYEATRLIRAKELKPFLVRGYPAVQVRVGRQRKNVLVHRMLADAFIPNPQGKPHVNHKDGDKANNALSNLEWVTHAENMAHAFRTGLATAPTSGPGDRSRAAKLNWPDVERIRALLAAGAMQKTVAAEFGVKPSTISQIARNQTWRIEA